MVHRLLAASRMASLALLVALGLGARAAEQIPPMPRSLAEAVRMEADDALPRGAFYDTPSLAGTRAGALLRQARVALYQAPEGVTAIRILYHSLDSHGTDVATSGVVLVPPGAAPAGGWPVIAWAHGTSGVARLCAPSLEKDLEYGDEAPWGMVRAGFAVVATDYHGLGTQGPHEYVNKIAQGRDVIYSVPAAHAAVATLGKRWVVIGHSQGGLAAWSVAEMESSLHDPDYLGAISVAGAAELRQLFNSMDRPGSESVYYLPYMAYAIHTFDPTFKPADMLVGPTLAHYPAVTTKGCWNYAYAAALGEKPGPALKHGWDEQPAAQRYFELNGLGSQPVGGPLLVLAGEADATVPLELLKSTVARACGHRIALQFRSYPGLDHDPTMLKSLPDQFAWVRERFAGKPFVDQCPALGAAH